ncbi:uncharacterized protein [Elaeis guineensis]|uniref:Uncharacterized protein LOC105059604 n=1 Tax=Elaeis guineensis var. tenera TaxID=51953 RepID=A0A6I9SDH0_ELAGV|nr:uncharacterized protein LOC105059604 [Elaeis guineensis]
MIAPEGLDQIPRQPSDQLTEAPLRARSPSLLPGIGFAAVGAAAGMGEGGGREGDWECGGCRNRNYAFRSLCNRCKQPRLLVDTKTPADSKWLPRIGDWICTGCSNNNYASREKCKKCGQSKEEGALPAIAMPGVSMPTYAQYFAMIHGLPGSKMNFGITGNPAIHPLPPSSDWSYRGPDRYRLQPASSWSLSGSSGSEYSHASNRNQLPVAPKGWRNGDWICNCGFHNYSSRTQCKKCNAPALSGVTSSALSSAVSDTFPALRTKRLASEELVTDWNNKRLNAGDINSQFLTSGQQQSYQGFEQPVGSSYDQTFGMYAKYSCGKLLPTPTMQVNMQPAQQRAVPMLLGKGAKQWREGDWMCCNCNNHNFASRSYCNRCKVQKDVALHSGSVG